LGKCGSGERDSDALRTMNPIYLAICHALIHEDNEALRKHLSELERTANEMPERSSECVRAEALVSRTLGDRALFSKAITKLCSYELDSASERRNRFKFVRSQFIQLKIDRKEDWISGACKAVLQNCPARPERSFVYVLTEHLPRIRDYHRRAALIADLREKCLAVFEKTRRVDPIRQELVNQMELLSIISIRNHWGSMKLRALKSEVNRHLKIYGKSGKHSEEACYCMLSALFHHRRLGSLKSQGEDDSSLKQWYGEWKKDYQSGSHGEEIESMWKSWKEREANADAD
jgi:hypothetical protein